MRFCNTCYTCKDESEFYLKKDTYDGVDYRCIKCHKAIIQLRPVNYQKNIKNNPNPKRKEGFTNGMPTKQYRREYYEKNKSKISLQKKKYNSLNRDSINKNKREYLKKRKKEDLVFRLKILFRSSCFKYFQKMIKNTNRINLSAEKILGASIEVVKKHIERQFKKGMTWENHGEWEIDHIIPLASAKTEEELKLLFHYRNLQPLWQKENKIKSDKILPVQVNMAL